MNEFIIKTFANSLSILRFKFMTFELSCNKKTFVRYFILSSSVIFFRFSLNFMKLGENSQKITVDDTIKYLTSVFLLQDKTNVINLKRKMDNTRRKFCFLKWYAMCIFLRLDFNYEYLFQPSFKISFWPIYPQSYQG